MHRTQHRRWILFIVVIILTLSVATPVLADYIGPQRTVTETESDCKVILNECQFVEDKNEWSYKTVDSWSCSLESKPWQAYPSDGPRCNENNPGAEYWSKAETEKTEIVTYPPATVSSSLANCTLQNGWCITAPQLSINGIEPVSGYKIIGIEGKLNEQGFACTKSICSVPLNQGINNFTYWALSSFLDSSEMGSFTAKVDSQPPAITSTISGTQGSNGWYLSGATLNSSAADATSGLAKFTCTRDGNALGSCNTIKVSSEGPHTLILTARDNAGHVRNLNRTVSIDTQNPDLTASLNGAKGSNSWYTSAELNASASDPSPGSGLLTLQYNLDNSGWKKFPVSGTLTLPEGKHSVDLRALDKAGRRVSSPTSFWLDITVPNLNIEAAGALGLNDWYIANPTLTASASDDTSGLDILEYNLNNSGWTTYTTPLSLSEGIHNVSFWAQDQAGLVAQVDRTYQVDTQLPQIAGSLSGTSGANGWFISDVIVSAFASDPLPGSDIDTFTYSVDGGAETPYTDPLTLSEGQHTVHLVARDRAGLSHSIDQTLNIDSIPPSVTIATELPGWVNGTIALDGTAADEGSGVSLTEISLDGGQTWQAATGTDTWSYGWNTTDTPNGIQEIRVRATDQAGHLTERTISAGVDNLSPEVSLPNSWFQWDTVTLDILDVHSGLAEARVEVSDPEGRWPSRIIQLDPGQLPLEFKWDRRFGDGTIAESGKYGVKVSASDRLGNTVEKNAVIHVLIEILPPGPTSTTQPYTPTVPVNTTTPSSSRTPTLVQIATQTSSSTTSVNITPGTSSSTPTAKIATSTSSPKATQVFVFGTLKPTVQVTATPTTILTPRPTPTKSNAVEWLQSVLGPEPKQESTTEIVFQGTSEEPQQLPTDSSVLWGTAATAAISAATAYAQEQKRKREEAKARQKALEEAEEERRQNRKEQKTAKMEEQRAQEAVWEAARQEQLIQNNPLHNEIKIARMEEEERLANSQKQAPSETNSTRSTLGEERRADRKNEIIEEEMNFYTAKPQEWQTAYESYMAQKAAAAAAQAKTEETSPSTQKKEKPWWEKAIKWVDDHQQEIAVGIGIAAAAVVIGMTGGLATPLVAAALVGGATLGAGLTAGALTLGLNKHYGRPWNENLLKNASIAGGVALALSGGVFLFNTAVASGTTFCSVNPATCQLVAPAFKVIDTVEQATLQAKLAYYTWTKNEAAAAEAALELHTELIDGGVPGNSVVRELGEQFSHLSKNAVPLIRKYGPDIVPLLAKHGDEALELIQKYGMDGVTLLQKYGNDVIPLVGKHGTDAVEIIQTYGFDGIAVLEKHGIEASKLIGSYGESAVQVLKAVDPKGSKKLLEALDDDVLEYALEQGPDAMEALSKWSPKELRLYGPELALRAKKDAKVLASIEKLTSLGPIDPKHLTREQQSLINAIAENSTQYSEEGQVVLGKWVDIGSGFVETAKNTGSTHYNPHPGMWNGLGSLGEEAREEAAWLINQKVIKNGIAKGKPFEYTLNDIPSKNINDEGNAVEAIFSGASDEEIKDILQLKYVPIRMKELQELHKAGYQYTFDNVSNSYILLKK